MAVFHKIDSILGINKKKEAEQKRFMAMGKQISKLTLEAAEKEKVIEALGKQSAMNMIKMAKMEKEILDLQGGK
ncbi:hypothetical protein [Anaerococcus sp. Marseille-P3625]|uniref:hypothetical protein n=1 Tax=Anaerococcus sp. Marseille-P3625 TaxID=1977277 RepID=UPI000C078189|nr:hypothetical protein [Anaerococcus sp. Marseille-P3625]